MATVIQVPEHRKITMYPKRRTKPSGEILLNDKTNHGCCNCKHAKVNWSFLVTNEKKKKRKKRRYDKFRIVLKSLMIDMLQDNQSDNYCRWNMRCLKLFV